MEQYLAMKKLAFALAIALWPGFAFAQCTGVFPAQTLCGNLTGSPAPPSAFAASGTIAGPGSSTLNGLPLWANTAGTQLKDGAGLTIAGNYTWGGTQTFSALANFTSTFQVGGNTMTFPGVAATLASWGAGNTWSGSQAGTFNVTGTFQIGGVTVALPVSVPNGGTGVGTLTAHGVLVGEGTSNVIATATGTAGQALISNGASADPSFQTPAAFQGTPANPTSTSSVSLVMMGLGTTCKITPATSGRVKFAVIFDTTNTSVTLNTVGFRFGTGTAPVNGAAVTGTAPGGNKTINVVTATANFMGTLDYITTGLAIGTAVWFDIALAAAAGTAAISNIDCNAMEF
jgi:hypothetical protein